METQSEIPLIRINVYGGRAHQIGHGPTTETGRGSYWHRLNGESGDMPTSVVTVHVKDGKPLTALGRKLLGMA